jgi:glycosyltransferase involved in cell wall biosynthesis
MKKNHKILFVGPAYNEEKNIENVVKEIKKDFSEAEVLIINDASRDNTLAVLKKINVKFLDMPFNVGYAMAVQAGFKYAFEHQYDYVIQFDGDGQHIASEAKRLIDKAINSNCDIVIGSRFLNKINYNHSFFRKIGTELFIFLIKIITNKSMTDPTSGFQCLNKKVIDRYSKIGNYPEFPDANLIIQMLLLGYKIEEVPVQMRQREFGESMHGGIIKPIKYMIKTFYTILMIVMTNIRFRGVS